jgi:Uma2 family endonuclease
MSVMSLAPVPEWLFPPEGGFTAADLDHLPDLPPHTELIDGSLILASPQASFHMRVLDALMIALRRTVPAHLRVRREMTVTLGRRQRPEPDVIVIKATGESDPGQTTYYPDDVLLAVEVVSPESTVRDRQRKPQLYAKAGIKHFWLVENEQFKPVLHTYLLDPVKGSYDRTGIHHGIASLDLPYPIEIDFSEIDRL